MVESRHVWEPASLADRLGLGEVDGESESPPSHTAPRQCSRLLSFSVVGLLWVVTGSFNCLDCVSTSVLSHSGQKWKKQNFSRETEIE